MSEMKLIKQWHLSWVDTQDIEYISSLGCEYETNTNIRTQDVTASNGQTYRYVLGKDLNYGVYITTKDNKQESLLMLKFADNIRLLRAFYKCERAGYEF